MRYFTRQWKPMVMLALFLLLTVGFQLGIPQLLRRFLDAVTLQAGWNEVVRFATFYIVAAFALRGIQVGENYLAELVAWKASNALRIDLVRHCLGLDLSFHLTHTPSALQVLEVRDLAYRHPGSQQGIHPISFRLARGQCLVIVRE